MNTKESKTDKDDLWAIFQHLKAVRPSERKFRLFSCYYWEEYAKLGLDWAKQKRREDLERTTFYTHTISHFKKLIKATWNAKKYADGLIDKANLVDIAKGWIVYDESGVSAASQTIDRAVKDNKPESGRVVNVLGLLEELFGDPLWTAVPSVEKNWLTPSVIQIATECYANQDFSGMPILADALEDAGCEDADILSHCRGRNEHLRGCWVLDLLLDKE